MTPAAFKRSIRDLQVWCSSCMVAFSGSDPIGVLIGAKRPSGTLVHKIAVHPDHRRQGHGRHLLDSLGSKLAILGPPRIIAEVPETLAACLRAVQRKRICPGSAPDRLRLGGAVERARATRRASRRVRDPCHGRRSRRQWSPWRGTFAGVLGALGRDPHRKEGRHRRTRRRLRRANRGLHPLLKREVAEAEIVSLRSFVEDGGARLKQLLSRLRARGMTTFRFPKVHPAEISKEFLETLGFRPAGGHLLYAARARSD